MSGLIRIVPKDERTLEYRVTASTAAGLPVAAHVGYRVHVPPSASLHWPALPHNPYRKDGHATPGEGRIELRVPFDGQHQEHCFTIEILP